MCVLNAIQYVDLLGLLLKGYTNENVKAQKAFI